MRRSRYIRIAFVCCVAVVLAAMGWISLTALHLDRAETEARRQAALGQTVQLALWQMDSTLTTLVGQESARPYFTYRPFLPVDRAYPQMFNDRGGGEMLRRSPLLLNDSPSILVHFQFEPDGRLTSPQAPGGEDFLLAVPNHVSKETVDRMRQRLAAVEALVDRATLLKRLPENSPELSEMVLSPWDQTLEQSRADRQLRRDNPELWERGMADAIVRNRVFQQQANYAVLNREQNALNTFSLASTDFGGVLMTPLWIDGQLLLARRVSAGGKQYVQGCLLNWPSIKAVLLETVEDALPEADLEPVPLPSAKEEVRMLAALPVRLVPGAASPGPEQLSAKADRLISPILLSLGVAWICVLLAAAAVGALLLGVIRLSERRASFVSAVTHELRTPLTTFQMYAEMLAEGMVSDAEQQKQYLSTLRGEAVRLTHMVENVLAYARLERGRADGRVAAVTVDQLLEPVRDRLADRARHAGMQLLVEADEQAGGTAVRANVSAAEQILFNLVDNACKYARTAADKRIHLAAQWHNGTVRLRLRDHGPGIPPSVRRRLFQPFSKSAQEAACTAPGVGLGLALSRRLARDMGGDLRLDEDVTDGACFVLTLGAAAEGSRP